MFSNFKNFFNIDDDTPYDDTLNILENFRNAFSGLSLNDGIFKILRREDVHKWRLNIALAFPRFANKFEPFAYDWLGSFYCVKKTDSTNKSIFIFNIGHNRCLLVPCDLLTFLEREIPTRPHEALTAKGYVNWLKNRPPLNYAECVGRTPPANLTGSDNISAVRVYNIDYYWQVMTDLLDERPQTDFVKEHYDFYLGKQSVTIKKESKLSQSNPDFAVLKYPPSDQFPMWRYVTLGMSSADDQRPIELYMVSSNEHDFIVDILTWVAYYHQNGSKLWIDDSFEIGEPWYEGSKCTHGLVCYPYIDSPEFKDCGDTSCLWLLPITEDEFEYHNEFGTFALEEKFAQCELNFLDYFRNGVV